jgi:hypothetical protein
MEPNQEEIYIQEQFDIESNLGGFTERLILGKKEERTLKERGNLTERCNLPNESVHNFITAEEAVPICKAMHSNEIKKVFLISN